MELFKKMDALRNLQTNHFTMPFNHSISLFLFLSTLPFLFTLTASKCHVDDETGLLAFKSGITQDPAGLLSTWVPGTDCCTTWTGIGCGSNNRVNGLSVYSQFRPEAFLTGTISPSLSKLRFLEQIFFQDLRNLSGTFPNFLFRLPNISRVLIENSKLSGPLPHNIGDLTTLTSLELVGSRFSGAIPPSISKLTRLNQLALSRNLLTGPIPDGIRQLRNLSYIFLDENQLSGPIPDFFSSSSFPTLITLRLSHNKFTGPIPAAISSLAPTLRFLMLGHNSLTGQIPSFLGNFRILDTLELASNSFTGVVPKSFGNLSRLMNLDLSRNFLVDPFPALNSTREIKSLDLSYNSFHLEQIPAYVTSSSIIYSLKLAKCGLKIKLEDWKPESTYAYWHIDLSDNEISGSPVGLLNRTDNLKSFKASNNQLNFDLEKLRIVSTLEELDLARNQVFGKVPKAVVGLQKLNLSYNKLCGSIPPNKFPASAFVGNEFLCGAPLTNQRCQTCP